MNQPIFLHANSQSIAPASNTLESVCVKGHVRDLACELTVEQVFVNRADQPIEAVYTFPLPFGAVLLDLVVKIGHRKLKGSVIAKKQAERRYEEAISEGDGAIMLEQSDDGVCTVNLGNLLPNERARLSYQYAYLLSWQQDTVKFRLPTTIAPRYGDPIVSGYQPHQIPVTDLRVENRFGLTLTIDGLLADALLDSPSHKISVRRKELSTVVSLSEQQAFMDRDFVLDMKSTVPNRAAGQITWDDAANSHTVLASFYPQIPGTELTSLCLKVVVDCSGSMAGNAIHQAQVGLRRILDNLSETDTFNIVRFGGHHQAFFPDCVAAEGRNLRFARQLIDQLAADMGGTEMGPALDFAYGLSDTSARPPAVLLITDGEINAHREVVLRAVKSGHRVFSVGVGAAVAEEFVKNIAAQTGGACELVTPNENMAEAIFRQFRRMYQPVVSEAFVEWPSRPIWQSPSLVGPVFAGDTIHLFAGFSNPAEGMASLILRLQDGAEIKQSIALRRAGIPWQALPRLAVAERIKCLDPAETATAEKMAVDYQLLTRHTNFLILDIREADQKAQELPKLVQVPQMLAAGWGGNGMVAHCFAPSLCDEAIYPAYDACIVPNFKHQTDSHADTNEDLSDFLELLAQLDQGEIAPKMDRADSKPIDTQAILKLVTDAGDHWLEVFLEQVLPTLEQPVQDNFPLLVQTDGWSEREVATAILFVILEAIDNPSISLALQNALNQASQYPELIEYFRHIDILAEDLRMSLNDPANAEKRPRKKPFGKHNAD